MGSANPYGGEVRISSPLSSAMLEVFDVYLLLRFFRKMLAQKMFIFLTLHLILLLI
jgi:hypothetical protein